MRAAAGLAAVALAAAADVHVDADVGRDAWSGSEAQPLRTVHAAQAAARRLRAAGAPHVRVVVRGSHQMREPLRLTAADEGTSYVGGSAGAAVHGGVPVPASLFEPWKGEVLRANLSGLVADGLRLGEITSGPGLGDCANDKSELYLNGERMLLARYPNVGADGFWVFLNAKAGFQKDGVTGLEYSDEDAGRVATWAGADDAWLHGYWKFDWADNYVRIGSVNAANNSISISNATPPVYGEVLPKARYYGLNILSELDAAGEYYIDRKENLLYFQPPGGKLSAGDVVMLSNMSLVVHAENTRDVHFTGLQVNYASGVNMRWDGVSDSTATGCNLGYAGDTSFMTYNGFRNTVKNNTLRWMGCCGLVISSGDERTLTRGDSLIEGNTVEHFSAWKRTYKPALAWGGVGNTYRSNTVRNGPHTAAQGGGNDNVFDGNTFDTIAYEVDDTGAWYAGRSWARRNNTLKNNLFKNVKNYVKTYLGYPSVQAIYNDDQLSANTIVNNTFVDCHCGAFIGGGRHHVVQGNRFIRTANPVHVDDRGLNWQKADCTPPNGSFWAELDSLHYKSPPYATHYPDLLKIATDRPCVPVQNVITDNTYCGADKFADFTDAQAKEWDITMERNTRKDSDCQ